MAQADIDSLQKEERAWPTAGKQFKLSRTSAQERMTFFLSFGERRKLLYFINNGVSILYVCYVLYLQIWNPQPVLANFVRIYLHRYIQIRTIWAMVYVSCTCGTYKYVQYRISHDVYIFIFFLYIYTYKDTYKDVFMCNGVRILCVLYIHTG